MLRPLRSFLEALKNPKRFRREAEQRSRHQSQLTAPADEPSIQALVEQLLRPEPDRDVEPKLRLLGCRAVPALIRALSDPRFDATKVGSDWTSASPLQRVLDALSDLGDPRAIEAVIPFIRHKDSDVRQMAALTLGSIGTDACVTPVAAALRDEDEQVRCFALIGIERGVAAGRSTQSFLSDLLEPVTALLDDPGHGIPKQAAGLILRTDRNRALPILLSERVFSARNPNIHDILKAFNTAEEKIPAERLLSLLEALVLGVAEYPNDRAHAEGLIALARTRHPEAERIIREGLDSRNRHVRRGAADALALLKGALAPRYFFYRKTESLTYESLTPPQRLCYVVNEVNLEVKNGGFAQYFFNSSGDHARDALAALHAMEATREAAILQRAMDLFGSNGPSANRHVRQDQLAGFSENQDGTLRKLNAEFHERPDDLDVLMSLYAAEHPEHFNAGR